MPCNALQEAPAKRNGATPDETIGRTVCASARTYTTTVQRVAGHATSDKGRRKGIRLAA